ncbi:MAG: hypothetical protein CMF51_03980 [Legionellales bacterium]|nr:hypothetical protein [Legionellales bacterium]
MQYPWLNVEQADLRAQAYLMQLIEALSPLQKKDCQSVPVQLSLIQRTLSLSIHPASFKPFVIDFNHHSQQDKINTPHQTLLGRACQLHLKPVIWDLTCGFGQDSFVLSSMPTTVISVEQHPIVGLMAQYAHWRLGSPQHWSIEIQTAEHALKHLKYPSPQVIYLDPMFPPKPKGRLSNKSMQILSILSKHHSNHDVQSLLQLALNHPGVQRIVLKYPLKRKPPLPPHHVIKGRSVQWCIYLRASNQN